MTVHHERRVKREKPTRCNESDVYYQTLSQHVSGIIMPIIRRTRVCTAAYDVLHWLWWLWLCGAGTQAVRTAHVPAPHNHSHHNQCRTPYAAVYTLVLLMMGIMMPETCWDKSLIINIRLVASRWFLSLHPSLTELHSLEKQWHVFQ